MGLVFWKLLAVLATVHLAVYAKTPESQSGSPPQKESRPLFSREYAAKPLRVLAILPLSGPSHYIMSETLMMELAKRGHQITMVSPFPARKPVANYTVIDLSSIIPSFSEGFSFDELVEEFESQDPVEFFRVLSEMDGPNTCRDVFRHPQVKAIINGEKQFDVLFTEIFGTDCYLGVGHKLQIPTISIVTSHSIPWMHDYVGDIDNPAFVESVFLHPTPEGLSSFVQRVKNTFYNLVTKITVEILMTRPSQEVVHEVFGKDFPSLNELRNNVSLLLVNTHPSVFLAKPTVPRVLPVGGLHLTPPNLEKIPQDIREWLDSAPNGVVYFSLGTLIKSSSMPERLVKAFVGAFRELKNLRFLWKLTATEAEIKAANLPDNVKIAKWLPQNDILSHPKTVAFITHGGLMGTTEAIYHGVPMVGMGVFAEQLINVFRYEKLGIAVRIDHKKLTKEDLVSAITKATSDPSLRRRVKEVSQLFRDRPMSPLDSAIWWTEYVVRHGGAPHLESPTAKMPFWQYALLDVAAAVLAVLLAVLLILVCVIKLVLRVLCRLFTRTKAKPKTTSQRRKRD